MTKHYPWEGEKTEKIQIRVTPEEKRIIKDICRARGGITVGRYLLDLHRAASHAAQREGGVS